MIVDCFYFYSTGCKSCQKSPRTRRHRSNTYPHSSLGCRTGRVKHTRRHSPSSNAGNHTSAPPPPPPASTPSPRTAPASRRTPRRPPSPAPNPPPPKRNPPYIMPIGRCLGNDPTTTCRASSSQKKYNRKQFFPAPFLRCRSSSLRRPACLTK